jgi:hypothetical protein
MTVRRAILWVFFALAAIALMLQCAIGPTVENIASCCIVFSSTTALLVYIAWTDALEIQPVSTFAIVGFCLTTQLGAMLAQTASWTPLIASLYDPLYTFSMLAFYQCVAMAVHAVYCLFNRSKPERQPLRGLFTAVGLYRTPTVGALWLMAIIGLASYYVSSFPPPLGKIGDAFNFLCFAPFLIPIYLAREGRSYCNPRIQWPLLIVHVAAIVLLALARNIRLIMFSGVVMVALNYLLIGMRSDSRVEWHMIRRLIVVGAIAGVLSSPMSYLTTAMGVAHAARGKVAADVMVAKTIKILQHPNLIAAFRAQEKSESKLSSYDEHYLSNPMMARFVETKFHDNAFHFAKMLSTDESKERYREITERSLIFLLPNPVIQMIGLKMDKGKNGSGLGASNGDYLVYLAKGVPLGGYKTGSAFAQGQVLFGVLFPFIYAVICWILYDIMDLLTIRSSGDRAFSTALAMMNTWRFFLYGITMEGLDLIFALVARYFLQMIIIYCLVQWIARVLSPGKKSIERVSPARSTRIELTG